MNLNIIKVIYLTLVLLGWQFLNQNCILFIFVLVSIVLFLAMSFAESKLLYRRNVANAIFHQDSFLFTWLQTRWYVLLTSILKALILGIIILISALQWSEQIVLLIFADVALLLVIYKITKYYLGKHTKADVNQIVARRISVVINIVILVPILIVVMFYSTPPEYLDSSLEQTLLNAQSIPQTVSCNIISILLSYDAMRDGLGWWLMTRVSSGISNTTYILFGWSLFLLFHTFYAWVFSKLILSTTIPWNTIFFKFKGGFDKPDSIEETLSENEAAIINKKWYQLDSFSLGFFGIIVILLVTTLTFLVEEPDVKSLQMNKHESKLIGILKGIDTLANSEKTENIDAMNHFIDVQVNRVFQSVYNNISSYSDTQYTWYRDYISIYQVAKKKISDTWKIWKYFVNKYIWKDDVQYPSLSETKTYAEKSSEELQRVLFGNGAFEREISTLNHDSNRYMQQLLYQSQGSLSSLVGEQLNTMHASDIAYIQEINRVIEEAFMQAKNELNKVAKTYKIGQAGVTIILTKTIMVKLLAKSGVKAVAKSGGFWVGGATGLAVCAPSGPWAVACGAVAGTLTWVGVDFVVSEVDEVLTKEAFEAKLHQEIDRNKEDLKRSMKQSYSQGISQVFNQIDSSIKRPIDRLREE